MVDRREFLGSSIEAQADDNTMLLLGYDGGAHAVVHGTVAGTLIEDFGAGLYFGTEGESGVFLNGEPFDFPGREETLGAPTWDWETQMRVLPNVVGPHREIPSRRSSRTSCRWPSSSARASHADDGRARPPRDRDHRGRVRGRRDRPDPRAPDELRVPTEVRMSISHPSRLVMREPRRSRRRTPC